jgi:hypothetical protein
MQNAESPSTHQKYDDEVNHPIQKGKRNTDEMYVQNAAVVSTYENAGLESDLFN